MIKWILSILLIFSLAQPVSALELEPPPVPKSGAAIMPRNTDSFGEGVLELMQSLVLKIRPDLGEASRVSMGVLAAVMAAAVLNTFSGAVQRTAELAGAATVVSLLLGSTNSMIGLGTETVRQLSEYGKLLFPVMTAALAAQGGVSTSAALYTGTAAFDALLSALVSRFLTPGIYVFLALAVANSAAGEECLKKLLDLTKSTISWCLKTLLTVFTTYISITGVVSGTVDTAALKATKVTISSVVPVVGGILSDASEAVLVSAGLMKNAAGVYGILAVLAVFLEPFLRIGMHYLTWKATAALCGIFGSKAVTALVEDFSSAMGLLLAMTGTVCLMLLISCVCFMKGVG